MKDEIIPEHWVDIHELAEVRELEQLDAVDYRRVQVAAIRRGALEATLIERLPTLRGVVKWGVGVDNIDLDACRERGIRVAVTPMATESVAEAVFALLLPIAKRLDHMRDLAKAGRQPTAADRGHELREKTLGLIGFGRIARHAARIAKGFQMRVIAYDAYLDDAAYSALGVERCATLEDVLAAADYVSLHCPLTKETRHLISERELRMMKPSAVIINTARGGIIDERALHEALVEGRIAAAGLDVFEQEPVAVDNPLLALPQVVATPHFLAAAVETRVRTSSAVADATRAFLTGDAPAELLG